MRQEIIFYNDMYDSTRYEDAKDLLFDSSAEEYGWEDPSDIPDNIVFNLMESENEFRYRDFENEFSRAMNGRCYLLMGTCGRWNGPAKAGQFIRDFRELASGLRHLDYIKVYEKDGHLYIEGIHHDGRDKYEIRELTDKGLEYARSSYFAHDEQLHTMIMNTNFYSRLPYFSRKIYEA